MVGLETVGEAAIEWLLQSILGNLFNEELEVWIRRVGLADDVEKLKKDMKFVQMVVAAAKGRKIGNEPLAQSLGDLRELLYDADDVMHDLDYYRLQEQVTSEHATGGKIAKLFTWTRSFICQQLGSILGKRKREDDLSANTELQEREISIRIKYIAGKLRDLGRDVSDALKIDKSKYTVTPTPKYTVTATSYIRNQVYGRDVEMQSILNLMTSNRSNSITVLPIVGVGGAGKTTLAQLVYNDPTVASQFQIRIWISVSDHFDVTRLRRKMFDSICKQRHTEIGNLNKLQQDLNKHMRSVSFLIVLDDVWDGMDLHCWDKLLAPLECCQTKGSMILVTTCKWTVVGMTRTVGPVELDDLKMHDFWPLFKSYAFGYKEKEEHPLLDTIGKAIAQELNGNPLAAKAVGALLRRNINIDSWNNILKNEEWKPSHENGIMPALKLSYDYLPEDLQLCFRYCCLFPKGYCFNGEELVRIWISQGFIHGNHTGKRLEDVGKAYLADLVNSGFLQQDARGQFDSNIFFMNNLMHDLALEVSRDDMVTIDGTERREVLPTTRHLSIVTGFCEEVGIHQHENAFSCGSLMKNLLRVTSVRTKLRSLVLIGSYDSTFFTVFQDMFKDAESLRLLQISATPPNFCSFIRSLVSCTHIRYVKVNSDKHWMEHVLPQSLSHFFHLQVLDIDPDADPTLPSGMSNLVNLRHLVVRKQLFSTIDSIGNMTALQELPISMVENASRFDIKQLQSLNQLVDLGIYQLENVRNKEEASEARLIDKVHLEELHLSWDATNTSSGASTDTTTEVLEGLKPHRKLKHLQITGFNGSISPSWLSSNLSFTYLQLLHIENCNELRENPPLENLLQLRKLELKNICHVKEVRIPPLEELVLIELPSLEICVASSMSNLDFHMRVLIIESCSELKVFTPFGTQNLYSSEEQRSLISSEEGTSAEFASLEAEGKKWLSGLYVLKINGCPHLMLSHPIPPSANTKVSIEGISTYQALERNSSDLLALSSSELRILDAKTLAFQNLTDLTLMLLVDCPNLVFLSFEGFRKLQNLRKMVIVKCGNLVSSCALPNPISETWKAINCPAFPSLQHLKIESCGGIAGKWLTEILPRMQSLEQLDIADCPMIKSLSVHEHRQEAESGSFASSSGHQAVVPTHFTEDEFLLHIPSNVLSTLKILLLRNLPQMVLCGSNSCFERFTSLTKLEIENCPMLLSSTDGRIPLPPSILELAISQFLPTMMQPFFPDNGTCLKCLTVGDNPVLHFLRLDFCTSLENLSIYKCGHMNVLEGLQYLSSLRVLSIEMNPELSAAWVREFREVGEGSSRTRGLLPPSLEELSISYLQNETVPYLLADLPCLSKLVVKDSTNLTSLQLGSLTALKHLELHSCDWFASLESLQSLSNLTDLGIYGSQSIPPLMELLSRQSEGSNIFPRLERLGVDDLSVLATSFCKHLSSLRCLKVAEDSNGARLSDELETALQLLTCLEELSFCLCSSLECLPGVLHSLRSLKRLFVRKCPLISSLPQSGLPPSLEELKIIDCSAELQEQCGMLPIDKLVVQIM